jgi:hypothetical protein
MHNDGTWQRLPWKMDLYIYREFAQIPIGEKTPTLGPKRIDLTSGSKGMHPVLSRLEAESHLSQGAAAASQITAQRNES